MRLVRLPGVEVAANPFRFFRAGGGLMSDNPFRELPPGGPYAAPRTANPVSNPLTAPAAILLVLAVLYMLGILLSLPQQVMDVKEVDWSTPEGMGHGMGQIGGVMSFAIASLLVAAGSICMLRQRGYSLALTAAIVSMIPVCSPCFVLGIPFGIWAMVLLRRPEVRARFP
jgi:hypothetical protein